MSAEIIESLKVCHNGVFLDANKVKHILSILEEEYVHNTYDTLTESEKQSIFELSQTYIVKYKEDKSGILLRLYSTAKGFRFREVENLQLTTNKIRKNEIMYHSWLTYADIRSITIPRIDILKYDCTCRGNCECSYTNLPMINDIQNLKIYKGKRFVIIKDNEMYKKYLSIP